jgi:hypothetical protein
MRILKTIGVHWALYSTIIRGIANGFAQLAKSVGAKNNKINYLIAEETHQEVKK